MQASNKGTDPSAHGLGGAVPAVVDAMFAGAAGYTVRCTPHRRTVMARTDDGLVLFGKLRDGAGALARAEWHWLHVLPMLGIAVPQPMAFERRGGSSLLCTAAVPGRPLDAVLLESHRHGRFAAAVRFACEVVAPRIAALHDHGLVFRDLYWNHLFATSLRPDAELSFVDVERVFRPRWRRFRWWIKDLAGLLASLPVEPSTRDAGRFLCAYLGHRGMRDRRAVHRWFAACRRKARRIRAHAPRYG
ncbi:MAG: lipopolysaccharide kinase InaA family protein [Planctomycetota bacterium]